MFKETIRSLFRKGSFTQDVAIVGVGKIIVTIVGFLFIPILSRIYTPEAYGIFSIYNATVTLLVTIFTLSYPAAMVIARDEKSFYNLFLLSNFLLFSFTIIFLLLILLVGKSINNSLHFFTNYGYLYYIPIGILLNGVFATFIPWNVRRKHYMFSSSVAAGHNILIRLINLFLGFISRFNNFGLIIGNQIGKFSAVIANLSKNLSEKKSFLNTANFKSIIDVAKNYKKYPLYFLPSQIVSNLNNQSSVYFIGLGFNKSILGNFSIAVSVLSIPVQILANSISSVFLEKANHIYKTEKKILPNFIKGLITKLFLMGVLPFSILSVFGEDLIVFFLGNQWHLAGWISAYMGPYFFLLLLISPIMPIFQVLKKEPQLFIFNITGLLLNIGALISGYLLNDINILIVFFTLSNVLIYLIQGIYIFKINGLSFWLIIIGYLIIYPALIIILYFMKNLIVG